jgi:hypothetical protein
MRVLTFFAKLLLISPYTLGMTKTLLLQINGLREFKKPRIPLYKWKDESTISFVYISLRGKALKWHCE